MPTVSKDLAEKEIKMFIERDNSENLAELVLELLGGESWDDQIYYMHDTIAELNALLIDPEVNKKLFATNPQNKSQIAPNLMRLQSFFSQMKTVQKARAEIQLEDLKQYGESSTERDLQWISEQYKKKPNN